MALRLACDLDGTLADMDSALQREAERLFGRAVSLRGVPAPADAETPDGADVPGLSSVQMRQLWAHVRALDNFWLTLNEIEPGAVARLAALRAQYGWEVLFLTQRPSTRGETAQLQSQRWLVAQGFDLPSVYVMRGSRGRVAAALALDAILDDRVENCLDVAGDSQAKPLLIWRGDPSSVPPAIDRLRIQRVASVADAIVELEAMTARASRPSGLMGRVRAAIGI